MQGTNDRVTERMDTETNGWKNPQNKTKQTRDRTGNDAAAEVAYCSTPKTP